VVAEPITNKLLISATPNRYDEVMRLIAQLDEEQPTVVIQVMVAEVDLANTEEFGIEIGLQQPVLFQRSILPTPATVTSLSPVSQVAVPGYNFNNTPCQALPLGNSSLVGSGLTGIQSLTNFATGRVSPNSSIGGFVFSAAS